MGPTVGPPDMHTARNVMAIPLSFGVYRSLRAAPTLLIGADPKIPPINLVINMLAAFLLVAVPILNKARQNTAGSIPHRRPYTSLIGPHSTGPTAHPLEVSRNLSGLEWIWTNREHITKSPAPRPLGLYGYTLQ